MRAGRVVLSALVAGALLGPAPAVAAQPVAAQPVAAEIGARTVTLISGDRLLVASNGRSAGRVPGSDRDGVALITQYSGGRLRIVPADAVPLLNADRLDPRLFDVTGLLDAGYDDSRADLPLIVTFDGRAEVGALVAGAAAQDLPAVNGSGVRVTRAQAAALWSGLTAGGLSTAYRKVWLDGVARPGNDVSVPLVGAPAAWAAGLTGGEVKVAVLDTGVDADHPDLAGAIAETADFTGSAEGGVDRAGHGTAVASIIAGSGAASAGRYRGMAPDARLYSAKVCASATVCAESSILQGMRWAAQDRGAKVVNLSAGEVDTPGTDLLEEAVGRLTDEFGTLFVAAAGNRRDRVWSPASAPAALAVGATTEDDTVAGFSDPGDDASKPDLMAPGVDITGARSGDSKLAGGAYTTQSGTSMAAPHVAGAAALVAQQHPDWTPAQIKAALMTAATPLESVRAGRLDVAKAIDTAVTAEPGSLEIGEGGETITYRNDGNAALTLSLRLETGAPDGAFALSGTTVRVPARGQAGVQVSAFAGDERFTGTVVAASGELALRTPVAVAAQSFAVSVSYLDRAGATTVNALGAFFGDGGAYGVGERLPRGTYALDAKVLEPGGGVTLLNRPALVVDRDLDVVLDARLGRPIEVTAPAGATAVYGSVGFTRGGSTAGVQDDTLSGLTSARIGDGALRTDVAAAWLAGSLYSAAWSLPEFATGFTRTPKAFVPVVASFAGTGTGVLVRPPEGGWGYPSVFALPATRTDYLLADTRWGGEFRTADTTLTAAFAPAGAVGETWNEPVHGPAFAPGHEISRTGDRLDVNPVWRSDGSGHGAPATGSTTVSKSSIVNVRGADRTEWTFRSARTAKKALLPLPVVRFTPGPEHTLGFTVQHQAGGGVTAFGLEISYDDGQTWQRPFYTRVGDRGVAVLRPPAGGWVSLRAHATNSAGNSVRQTLIRGYPAG